MKLFAVMESWFFYNDVEDLCSKGGGHSLLGIYTDLNSARERFHDERDFQGTDGWPVSLLLSADIETDIDTTDTFWMARLDGYGYTKISIETLQI